MANEFKHQSGYDVHFPTNILGKGMNFIILHPHLHLPVK